MHAAIWIGLALFALSVLAVIWSAFARAAEYDRNLPAPDPRTLRNQPAAPGAVTYVNQERK